MLRALALLVGLLLGCAATPPGRQPASVVVPRADPKQGEETFAPCPSELPAEMVCIPGGSFLRGGDEGAHASPAETVSVSTFLLDVHEVTNAAWNACVAAGGCRRLTRFRGYLGDAQPAVGMRWDEAAAFCERGGGRLPSEAEWERAASGPSDTAYPWGDAPGDGCEHAVVRTRDGRGCGRGTTWPVMSLPADGYGLYDMAGNVWEWTADVYTPCYRGCERACGDACSGRDPRGPCGGAAECPEGRGLRVVRGGSWWHAIDRATVAERRGVPAANPNPHRFGFRCARSVP
jgi:sulfatase modifying factor 1